MSVLSRPKAWWSGWVHQLDRREPGTALALLRILSGSALLASVGSVVASDLVDVLWVDVHHGGMRALTGNWLVQALGGATPVVVWSLVAATLVAGLLLTVGLLPRLSALVSAQGLLALSTLNSHARSAYDPLLINSLWLLVLADSAATLSLHCRWRNGRWTSDRLVTAWPRYLAILQLVVLYTFTGLHKISIHWTPAGGFSALYYILQQPSWQRTDMTWLASVYPLTQIATAITWIWELTWPVVGLALWFRHTAARSGRVRRAFNRVPLRTIYVCIGVCMHLTVTLVMVVGPFSWITLAYYPCLFRADELRRAYERLALGVARRPPPAATPR